MVIDSPPYGLRPGRLALAGAIAVACSVAILFGVAAFPLGTVAAALGIAAAAVLLRKFGLSRGTWYLALFLLAIREPLGFDVHGSLTLYPGDLAMLIAAAATFREHGLRSVWASRILRIGIALIVASVIGFFVSPAPSWEVAHIYRIFFQVLMFAIARQSVSRPEDATRALVAFGAGMIFASAVGFWQSTLPVGSNDWPYAYDENGTAHSRVPGSFDHPLHYSMALSVATSIAIGLVFAKVPRATRIFAFVLAIVTAIANQYTYSVSALIGTGAGAIVALAVRNWKLAAIFPLAASAWLAVAPEALFVRISGHLTGESGAGLARLLTYQQGVRAYLDHPIFGVGWGGISRLSTDEYRASRASAVASAPENYFLYRIVALGIPGLVLYPLLLGLFVRNVRSRGSPLGPSWPRAAIAAAGAAFYTQGMLVPVGWVTINIVMWTLFALAEVQHESAGLAPVEARMPTASLPPAPELG